MDIIRNLERFPRTLKQRHPLTGCIPTSIAAVLAYYGASELAWNECTIHECVLSAILRDPGESFTFRTFKRHFLDQYLDGRLYRSDITSREELGEWKDFLLEKVRDDIPVIASFSHTAAHVMTVVGVASSTTELQLHDPAIGDFRVLDVEPTALLQSGFRRNNDVLWIEQVH
jgi:hypothetical protein